MRGHRRYRPPRRGAAVRRRGDRRQRRPRPRRNPAAGLRRRGAGRPQLVLDRPPLPPEHPPPARPAQPSAVDHRRRGVLRTLRYRQPAGRPLHRRPATDAADGRRHARHAVRPFSRRFADRRRRLGGRLPVARLGHRRSPAPAVAGRLLERSRDRRGLPGGAGRRGSPGQPAAQTLGNRCGGRAEPGPAAGDDRRLAVPPGPRPRPDDAGPGASQRRPEPGDGGGHPARRFPHPVHRRRAARRYPPADPAMASGHLRHRHPGGYRAGQPDPEDPVRPRPPGSAGRTAEQLQLPQRTQLGVLRLLPHPGRPRQPPATAALAPDLGTAGGDPVAEHRPVAGLPWRALAVGHRRRRPARHYGLRRQPVAEPAPRVAAGAAATGLVAAVAGLRGDPGDRRRLGPAGSHCALPAAPL